MRFHLPAWFVVLATATVASGWGCSSSKNGDSGFNNSSGSSGSSSSGGADGGSSSSGSSGGSTSSGGIGSFGDSGKGPEVEAGIGCTNLQCQIDSCDGGKPTTISGKVMDPAGHNPLYNVVVLIPNTMGGVLPLIPGGLNSSSCSCGALFDKEEPVVDTVTAPDGTFTLKNVPSGKNIPVVVQIGKWRKEIVLPNVTACQDNPAGSINLPKNGKDGLYASMPSIAVSTGFADTLECLLTRIGIDESEFTGDPNSPLHVHVFQGAGGNTTASPAAPASSATGGLWDTDANLKRYDITMLSCEGSPTTGANSQTVADYVNVGGRVFAEHYHYQFFANTTQFPNTANWAPNTSSYNNNPITGLVQTTLLNGKAFPEGAALEQWLTGVGALTNNLLPITIARNDATVVMGNVSTPWVVTGPSISPAGTQYFSWDMPFNPPVSDAGVPEYCGRVVYSDLHVSGGQSATAVDYTMGTTVPTGCANTLTLSPDEDAIEFIFFDLSSCVVPIGYPPKPPPAGPEAGAQ